MRTRVSSFVTYLLPSTGTFLWIGIFLLVLGLGRRMVNGDGDLGRHITVGNYILDHAMIPVRDVFSHTMAGQPLTPHEWLAEVIFALAHRILGLNGPVLVSALTIATAFWLLFMHARSERQNLLPVVFAVSLATLGSSLHWLSRPHIFTFLLLALWMIALRRMSNRPHQWWLLPVLMLIWANTHGAFIAGLVTWALFGAGLAWRICRHKNPETQPAPDRFWRSYLLAGAVSFVASLINPAGIQIWMTSIGFITNKYLVSHTVEYAPPRIQYPNTWLFCLFSAL